MLIKITGLFKEKRQDRWLDRDAKEAIYVKVECPLLDRRGGLDTAPVSSLQCCLKTDPLHWGGAPP